MIDMILTKGNVFKENIDLKYPVSGLNIPLFLIFMTASKLKARMQNQSAT